MRMADIRDESMTELDFTMPIQRSTKQVEDEPRVPSICQACKTPIKRLAKYCAQCRVAA